MAGLDLSTLTRIGITVHLVIADGEVEVRLVDVNGDEHPLTIEHLFDLSREVAWLVDFVRIVQAELTALNAASSDELL